MLIAQAHHLDHREKVEVVNYLKNDADKALRAIYNRSNLQLAPTSTSVDLSHFYEIAGVYLASPDAPIGARLMFTDSIGAMPQEIFLRCVEAIESYKGTQAAMVAIYDHVGDLFVSGDLKACDLILGSVDSERMNPDLLLSLLSATSTAPEDRLPSRKGLYDRVNARFVRDLGSTEAKQLLDNLA